MLHALFILLVVIGIILAIFVIKWLFVLAVVAALCWAIVFFARRVA